MLSGRHWLQCFTHINSALKQVKGEYYYYSIFFIVIILRQGRLRGPKSRAVKKQSRDSNPESLWPESILLTAKVYGDNCVGAPWFIEPISYFRTFSLFPPCCKELNWNLCSKCLNIFFFIISLSEIKLLYQETFKI